LETLLLFVKIAVGAYVLILAVLYFSQGTLLYAPNLPTRELIATPEELGLPYEPVNLRTEDGKSLHAWFVPARNARAVMLFFHGNAGNISHRLHAIELFHRLNVSILIFDYRGYGKSSGTPSEQGTYRDARAALAHLTDERRVPMGQIVYYGNSLGTAVASHLAVSHPPAALILDSGFTSVPDMAASILPLFPARWMSRYSYNNAENLSKVDCPVLIVHSPDDEIIPFAHGQKLHALANEPKRFLKIRGSHNESFFVSKSLYLQGIDKFLREHL
jgi:fermentation-respiration switch protein FrsA (DUF1100 family)